MDKIVYIIPGFTESTKSKGYKKIIGIFKKQGFKVIEVKIKWKNNTITNYVEQFTKNYNPQKGSYVFGFSFGAMIAVISASKVKPKTLILCSLSPYFREDLPITRNVYGKTLDKYFKKHDFDDLKNQSFKKISKGVKCRTIILVGDKEGRHKGKSHSFMLNRAKDAEHRIKNSQLFIIKNGKHDIAQKEYQAALKKVIYKL